ncbi:MAG: glycosyltransferase family 4 protein [Planctomycetes bacterium]|nr:glycosyltransferase family 4 protein [Planctomycetota bacterium]
MKIALVAYTWSETLGGVERYVFDLARGLLARGHEVHAWCRRRDGDTPGIAFHEVPGLASGHTKYVTFARETERLVKLDDYDAVHGFGRAFAQDLLRIGGGCHEEYLRQAKGRTPGPLWFLFHPKDRALIRLEHEVFRRRCWKRLVCISRRVAEEVHRIHGVPLAEALVIHNGTDLEKFHPRRRAAASGPARILFVGSGFERKGLAQAVEALGRVKGDWRLRVVGKGSAARYASQAARLGIGARVEFAGTQPDMPAEYGRADVLLFPTLYDAFGTVTLEAMATGIPVVVSRQAGSSEVVDDGADGRIVEDPRDPGQLASALEPLVNDAALRAKMGLAARAKAEKNGIDANIEKVVALYREIARGKGRG